MEPHEEFQKKSKYVDRWIYFINVFRDQILPMRQKI